jgi:hypothetical protein
MLSKGGKGEVSISGALKEDLCRDWGTVLNGHSEFLKGVNFD